MYNFFGGVAKILVPDNCKTAVIQNNWYTQKINTVYREMAEHYGTAVIPARVRKPKDKPNVEGAVGNISTWITAALRKEQFFSLSELNHSIKRKTICSDPAFAYIVDLPVNLELVRLKAIGITAYKRRSLQ